NQIERYQGQGNNRVGGDITGPAQRRPDSSSNNNGERRDPDPTHDRDFRQGRHCQFGGLVALSCQAETAGTTSATRRPLLPPALVYSGIRAGAQGAEAKAAPQSRMNDLRFFIEFYCGWPCSGCSRLWLSLAEANGSEIREGAPGVRVKRSRGDIRPTHPLPQPA